MLRKLATIALCISSLASASDTTVAAKHLLASSQRYNVTHDANGFKVNGQRVHDYDLDASLRGSSADKARSIRALFKSDRSKLEVSQIGSDYAIKRHEQLKGGGPVAGAIAYWLTKTLCYSTAVAGAAGAVAATGGAVGFVAGGAAVGATLGASAPVAVIGGAIAQAGLAAPAATATLAVVQATGGMTAIASTVATVELASTHMGIIFTCMPWLP